MPNDDYEIEKVDIPKLIIEEVAQMVGQGQAFAHISDVKEDIISSFRMYKHPTKFPISTISTLSTSSYAQLNQTENLGLKNLWDGVCYFCSLLPFNLPVINNEQNNQSVSQ